MLISVQSISRPDPCFGENVGSQATPQMTSPLAEFGIWMVSHWLKTYASEICILDPYPKPQPPIQRQTPGPVADLKRVTIFYCVWGFGLTALASGQPSKLGGSPTKLQYTVMVLDHAADACVTLRNRVMALDSSSQIQAGKECKAQRNIPDAS